MTILKLKPACKDYLWGGHRLVDEYHVKYDGDVLAEAWMLSCHKDGPSLIANGAFAGKTLQEYIDSEGFEVLGTHCRRFREFPILIKFIDAKDNLSIQVHPSNRFALQNEGQYGKTEMWYVLDAEPGAILYYGFKQEISKEEFAERIKNNTLLEALNAVHVKKGDVLFIESGTIHAIGKGILVAEIQQNSNITYRVYDYGRVGKDGKKRDLHIEKALAVTNRVPIVENGAHYPHIADCDYFTVDKLDLDGKMTYRMQGYVSKESFLSILILDGHGTISCKGEKLDYEKGDSFFLAADSGDWEIQGTCDALMTTIRAKASPMRVGVIIGSAKIQIGIVDDNQAIIDQRTFPMDDTKSAERVIEETAENVLDILHDNHVPLDQCVGVGVGVPGTIDRRKGIVLYSNNIRWENVPLVSLFGRVVPCPVRIANDADCAALGEAAAGAGKDCADVILLTLGNGVGGGIILNGEVFEGSMIGGAELGHMVVRHHGRACTCGRRGCLEAYTSIPSLMRSIKQACGQEYDLEEIFSLYKKGDPRIVEVIEQYGEILGCGIVNIVNIFRPQMILIGGMLSPYASIMLEELRRIVHEESFGGSKDLVPEIEIAKLGESAGMIGAANL